MWNPFKKLWKPEKVWNHWEHQGRWGHNIDIVFHDRTKSVSMIGHYPCRYEWDNGHELRVKMKSGKIGRYKIENIKYFPDPRDMFRADLNWQGYAENVPEMYGNVAGNARPINAEGFRGGDSGLFRAQPSGPHIPKDKK